MMADILAALSFALLLASHVAAVIALHDPDNQELFGRPREGGTDARRRACDPRTEAGPRRASSHAIPAEVPPGIAHAQ